MPEPVPAVAPDLDGGPPQRTRGGWVPTGTASHRRSIEDERRTAKGHDTRQRILAAARTVFERRGYNETNVAEIVDEAGVSRGTFYTYFRSKREIFRVLFATASAAILEVVTGASRTTADPVRALSETNRRFVAFYSENAGFHRLVDQADTVDPELRSARLARRALHVQRVARAIRGWQEGGYADPRLDAETTAAALISMTTDLCYWRFVGHESLGHDEEAVATLNRIWLAALDLRSRPDRRPPR